MDLSKRVDYEFLYTLELKDPETDVPIGVMFKIRSSGSDAAKAVLRNHTKRTIENRIKGKAVDINRAEEDELEKAASYIAEWHWGDNEWKGTKSPPLTMTTALEVVRECGWIFSQVVEAATSITNFTQGSPKSAAKLSVIS